MIAMALLCRPELIIADEPTTALDVTIQAQILAILSSLQQELDMSMLFITHDLGVISRVADRVMVMYAGQVVESGSVKTIFSKPLHPYTKGLMKCIPVPGETKRGNPLGTIAGFVPLLTGRFRGCRFHDRCPYVINDCLRLRVPLHKGEENHQYRCLHPPEKLNLGSKNMVQL
jgi:peptide/nickel transport system ATP-binding protein